MWAGLRRDADAAVPRAATWPRGKLAAGLAVAIALHLMTFWNLDLAVRQRVETLRVEAGAIALSVAPVPVLDRDNAALLYEQAFQARPRRRGPRPYAEKWSAWLQRRPRGL